MRKCWPTMNHHIPLLSCESKECCPLPGAKTDEELYMKEEQLGLSGEEHSMTGLPKIPFSTKRRFRYPRRNAFGHNHLLKPAVLATIATKDSLKDDDGDDVRKLPQFTASSYLEGSSVHRSLTKRTSSSVEDDKHAAQVGILDADESQHLFASVPRSSPESINTET